ncbi:MAG: hypothetical protein AABY22_09315 [Nanoarchaeota archaeon]
MKLIYPKKFEVKYICPAEANSTRQMEAILNEIAKALKLTGKCLCCKDCSTYYKNGKIIK